LTSRRADRPQTPVTLPIISNFLASEILALLKWWLDHNMPYPPERMDEIFHELVTPGFRSALGSVEADATVALLHIHPRPPGKT
jgi:hypothetical protein